MTIRDVAILGASSHIARGLIVRFCATPGWRMHLFARRPEKVNAFLDAEKISVPAAELDDFESGRYDLVINCVGAGVPGRLGNDYSVWFTLTEEFDNRILRFLARHPETLYINFSSGAVYGGSGSAPVEVDDGPCFAVNRPEEKNFYTVARLNAEFKHRAMKKLRIVDLRIFSYFSRFASPDDGYFMTDVLAALLNGSELATRRGGMVRDYIVPDDLFALIECCAACGAVNSAFDAYSGAPAEKTEILNRFQARFGLRFRLDADAPASPNGERSVYCSNYRAAEAIGYHPRFTALEGLENETAARLMKEGLL